MTYPTNLSTTVPKFDGTNWPSFKQNIKVVFNLYPGGNLWLITSGAMTRPDDAAKEEARKFDECEWVGYSHLHLLLEPHIQGLIADLKTASTAWAALKHEYEKDSAAHRIALRSRLYGLTHSPGQPVSEFINKLQEIARELKAINRPLSKSEDVDILLLRLDPTFEPVRASILAQQQDISFTDAATRIREFEQTRIVASATKIESEEDSIDAVKNEALYARGDKNTEPVFDWGNTSRRSGACHRCGLLGHQAAMCIHDMPRYRQQEILNETRKTRHARERDSDRHRHYASIADESDDDTNNTHVAYNNSHRRQASGGDSDQWYEFWAHLLEGVCWTESPVSSSVLRRRRQTHTYIVPTDMSLLHR
jgi:hypothetical protein